VQGPGHGSDRLRAGSECRSVAVGGLTADDQRYADHANRRINQNIDDYMGHCRHVDMNKKTLHMKQVNMKDMIVDINPTRLADLEPNAVDRYLRGLKQVGRSERTVNYRLIDVDFYPVRERGAPPLSLSLHATAQITANCGRRRPRCVSTDTIVDGYTAGVRQDSSRKRS